LKYGISESAMGITAPPRLRATTRAEELIIVDHP
jgi:hypothetical protein